MNNSVDLEELHSKYSYNGVVCDNSANVTAPEQVTKIEFKENFFPFISRAFSELFYSLIGRGTPEAGLFHRKIVCYTIDDFKTKIDEEQARLQEEQSRGGIPPEGEDRPEERIDKISKMLFGISKQIPKEYHSVLNFSYKLFDPEKRDVQNKVEGVKKVEEQNIDQGSDFVVGPLQYYSNIDVRDSFVQGYVVTGVKERLFLEQDQFYYLTKALENSLDHVSFVAPPSIDRFSLEMVFYDDRMVLYAPIKKEGGFVEEEEPGFVEEKEAGFVEENQSEEENKPVGFIAVFWYDEKSSDVPGVVLPKEVADKIKNDLKNEIKDITFDSGKVQIAFSS